MVINPPFSSSQSDYIPATCCMPRDFPPRFLVFFRVSPCASVANRYGFLVPWSPIPRFLFQIFRSPFTVHRSLFTVHRSPFTALRSPLAGLATVRIWRSNGICSIIEQTPAMLTDEYRRGDVPLCSDLRFLDRCTGNRDSRKTSPATVREAQLLSGRSGIASPSQTTCVGSLLGSGHGGARRRWPRNPPAAATE